MQRYLKVWGEVSVGLVLVGLIQVVLGQRENQEVSVVAVSSRYRPQVLLHSVGRFPQRPSAAVLQPVQVLLWARDEERVHPEVEHLFLEGTTQSEVTTTPCLTVCS